MGNAWTVTLKEFKSYFRTPIGYVLIALFVGCSLLFFFQFNPFFTVQRVEMRSFFDLLPIWFLFFVPAITMRLWSEEKKLGTIESLLTMPLSYRDAIVGKFLGAWGLVAVMLALTFPLPLILSVLGEPDWGPIFGGYLGALLVGAAYVAIGSFASVLTENQVIAFLIGVSLSFGLYILNFLGLSGILPDEANEVLQRLSLVYHFQSIGRGVIDSRDLLYYLGVIVFFLLASDYFLRERSTRNRTGFILATAILVMLNVVGLSWFTRIDLTQDRLYTLHEDTRGILSNLEDEMQLRVYLTPSREMPDELSTLPRDIRDVLDEFEMVAGEALNVRVLDASREDVRQEAQQLGVPTRRAIVGGVDSQVEKLVYMGAVLEYADSSEILPELRPRTLEYDLALAMTKVLRGRPPTVMFNEPIIPEGLPDELVAELKRENRRRGRHDIDRDYRRVRAFLDRQFRVLQKPLTEPIEDDVDVLVLANKDELIDASRFYVDQFLMRGGKVILLIDGADIDSRTLLGTERSDLNDEWLASYGVFVGRDVVLDMSCQKTRVPDESGVAKVVAFHPVIEVRPETLNREHPITAELRASLFFPFAASVSLQPPPGTTATELVRSSPRAWRMVDGFVINPQTIRPPEDEDEFESYTLASLLVGEFQSHFKTHPVPEGVVDRLRIQMQEREASRVAQGTSEADGGRGDKEGPKVIELPDDFDVDPVEDELKVDVIENSISPGAILAIGTSEFIGRYVTNPNASFFQNVVEWMAIGDQLLSIRARVIRDRRFEEVPEEDKFLYKASGIGLIPITVLLLGFGQYFYRRHVPRRAPKWLGLPPEVTSKEEDDFWTR